MVQEILANLGGTGSVEVHGGYVTRVVGNKEIAIYSMIQFFYVTFLISPFISALWLFVIYLTAAWYLLKHLLFGPFLKPSSKNWIIEIYRR